MDRTETIITGCNILWSENSTIDRLKGKNFPTLAALDAAVAEACQVEPPPPGGAYDKTGYCVAFSDGIDYEGRCDVTRDMVDSGELIGRWMRNMQTYVANTDGDWISDEDRSAAREILAVLDRSEKIDRLVEYDRVIASMGPRAQAFSVGEVSDPDKMTADERVGRVLRKLLENVRTSRQSSREWADVTIAYASLAVLDGGEATSAHWGWLTDQLVEADPR